MSEAPSIRFDNSLVDFLAERLPAEAKTATATATEAKTETETTTVTEAKTATVTEAKTETETETKVVGYRLEIVVALEDHFKPLLTEDNLMKNFVRMTEAKIQILFGLPSYTENLKGIADFLPSTLTVDKIKHMNCATYDNKLSWDALFAEVDDASAKPLEELQKKVTEKYGREWTKPACKPVANFEHVLSVQKVHELAKSLKWGPCTLPIKRVIWVPYGDESIPTVILRG